MPANGTITIAEMLRGCEPGRIQSVGFMQVIPLISDLQFPKYVAPRSADVNNPSYHHLDFNNQSDAEMIIPAQTALISKQKAQDHSMTHAGLVAAKQRSNFGTAVCIQESQPGNIRADESNKLIVLPFSLREDAHKMRKGGDLGRLWPSIRTLIADSGLQRQSGNLVVFLDHYETQFEQFVAEFEPVPNQVGAIIMIGGEVVGVERTPNVEYWKQVWTMLVRECYGSLAILEARKHNDLPPIPRTRVSLRKVNSIDDLRVAVEEAKEEEHARVSSLVNRIAGKELKRGGADQTGSTRVETVGDDNDRDAPFLGQIVLEGQKVVYASLVATKTYRDNSDWFEREPFAM